MFITQHYTTRVFVFECNLDECSYNTTTSTSSKEIKCSRTSIVSSTKAFLKLKRSRRQIVVLILYLRQRNTNQLTKTIRMTWMIAIIVSYLCYSPPKSPTKLSPQQSECFRRLQDSGFQNKEAFNNTIDLRLVSVAGPPLQCHPCSQQIPIGNSAAPHCGHHLYRCE